MNGALSRIVLPIAALGLGALAVVAVIDRMGVDQHAAARGALYDREAALVNAALAPGSPLACLAGTAGETTGNACERRVFATPESTAAAVAYMGARLQLLKDAAAIAPHGDEALRVRFAATRRAVELDRYGLAAQVLAERDGCTPDKCAAFALLDEASALKANMKAQAFDQYVSRYAAAWNAPGPAAAPGSPPPAALSAAPALPAPAGTGLEPGPSHHPLSSKYDFPSAASIPPVSIMNAEPPLPKAAQAGEPAPAAQPRLPPKRPQAESGQAAPPAAAR